MPYRGMTRLLAGGLVAAALTGVPMSSARAYTPAEFVTPLAGDTVSGTLAITATTDAPYLLIRAAQEWSPVNTGWIEQVVPAADGRATWQWPTFGFESRATVLYAVPCDTAAQATCHFDQQVSQRVAVDNQFDVFDVSAVDTSYHPAFDPPIEVTLEGGPEGGDLHVMHDYQDLGSAAVGASTTLSFPTTAEDVGRRDVLRVLRCSTLNSSICVVDAADTQFFFVRHGLGLSTAAGTQRFSPNGDGRSDAIGFPVRAPVTPTYVEGSWTLLTTEGQELVPPTPMQVGPVAPFEYGVYVDPLAAGATDLPEGDMVLRATVKATEHGHLFSQTLSIDVESDLSGPPPAPVTTRYPSFAPHPDFYPGGYRDRAVFDIEVDTYPKVAIVDSDGTVMAEPFVSFRASGSAAYTSWDGDYPRTRPEGDYRLRVVLSDDVGNQTVSYSAPVTLSYDYYQEKSRIIRVSAQKSLFDNWSGRCGRLRKPGLRGGKGSIGYYSEGKCKTDNPSRGAAAAAHRLRLPAGDWFDTLRFRVDGGPLVRNHRAGFLTISNDDTALGSLKPLDDTWRWHLKVQRRGKDMVWPDGSIYWLVNSGYGQRYDVRRFEVKMVYGDWTGVPGSEPYPAQVPARSASTRETPDRGPAPRSPSPPSG